LASGLDQVPEFVHLETRRGFFERTPEAPGKNSKDNALWIAGRAQTVFFSGLTRRRRDLVQLETQPRRCGAGVDIGIVSRTHRRGAQNNG
jgi:hypothetical protein